MQCWNCGFENIPGMHACSRCSSALELADVAIEPPRRTAHRAGATALTRLVNRVRAAAESGWNAAERSAQQVRFIPNAADRSVTLAWCVLPGLGHLRAGLRFAGTLFLGLWLLFLLLMVASLATEWSWMCLAAMIAVHGLSITTLWAMALANYSLLKRALCGLLIYALLVLWVYMPLRWLCLRILVPLPTTTLMSCDAFSSGDGLLAYGPWLRPKTFERGALVAYHIGASTGEVVVRRGIGLDRVIGVAGDRVTMANGKLCVNGLPPKRNLAPLGYVPPTSSLDIQLADQQYCILPTRLRIDNAQGHTALAEVYRRVALVEHDDIIGRVFFRLRPWSHFGWTK
ncbi:MAG: hypothetical protein KKB50_21750 [Planctomycetes bacterium]|nr:hypothetical protein [Planctomycetota bacterium]